MVKLGKVELEMSTFGSILGATSIEDKLRETRLMNKIEGKFLHDN